MNKTKGFTLVELIVTITILAILGTIAFIALQGYSTSARDSTRISDISSIKSTIELFQLDAGKYPVPTNGTNITYSGSNVWIQGEFGETVFKNVSRLNKIPTDPNTDKNYTYSTTSNRFEYQIGGIMEGDQISLNNNYLNNKTNAGEIDATAYVVGNYNGVMTKTNSGTTCNILSIPSIITNDTSITDLQTIVQNNSFVYRGYKNLPSTFKTSKFKYDGGFGFTTNKLIAYTDTGSCSELINPNNYSSRLNLLKGLQDAYTGTILNNIGEIKNITSLNIDLNNPSTEIKNYANTFINNVLGTKLNSGITNNNSTSTGNTTIPDPWTLPSNIKDVFATGSIFTDGWSSMCNPNNITIVDINPGTNTIPTTLNSNTIYRLNQGDYIVSATRNMNQKTCIGLIGSGSVNVYSSVQLTDGIIDMNSLSNKIIVSGIKFDGYNNGLGSTHTKNQYGIKTLGTSNLTFNNLIVTSGGTNTVTSGIYLNTGSNCSLNNIKVNSHYTGLYIGAYVTNLVVTNSSFYNNAYFGINGYLNGGYIKNVNSYNNLGDGIAFGTSQSNPGFTFENINTYNNGNDGIGFAYVYNVKIKNLNSFNNIRHGINLSYTNYIGINNGNIYNNSNGLNYDGVKYSSFSNINIFNNSYGLFFFTAGNHLNTYNLYNKVNFYNNNYGIYISNPGPEQRLFNVRTYNNINNGIISSYTGNKYYGTFKIFGNGNNTLPTTTNFSTGLTTDSFMSGVEGINNGIIDSNNETFGNNWVVKPNVIGWNINTKGKQTLTFSGSINYSYGTNIQKQVKPAYHSGTMFNSYGTDGIDYNSTKYIGEW